MTTGVEKHIYSRIKRGFTTPSLKEIESSSLTKLANENWAESKADNVSQKIIVDLYEKYLSKLNISAGMLLELSCYLENYLWPNYEPGKTSFEHIMSMVYMVNEKCREGLNPWECFNSDKNRFSMFLQDVIQLEYTRTGDNAFSYLERVGYILFLIHLNQSLENEVVRKSFLRLVSLPLWFSLNPGRLQKELKEQPQLRKRMKKIIKSEKKNPPKDDQPEKTFIPKLVQDFLDAVKSITASQDQIEPEKMLFCERFVELLIDLISQLPTRTFLHPLLEDFHLVVECKMSPMFKHEQAKLFGKLLDIYDFYMGFEVNNFTGEALTHKDMTNIYSNKILSLQVT